MQPKISVIIPVYNVEKYLRECLDSIVKQTLNDIEIICVNDGSTDNSGAILEEYSVKDKRIRVITQENGGLSSARNCGIRNAIGKYIAFVDSDDFIAQNMMEKLYNKAECTNSDITVGDLFLYFHDTKETALFRDQVSYLYLKNKIFTLAEYPEFVTNIAAWDRIYLRSFLEDIHAEFPNGLLYEDQPFTVYTLLHAKRISVVPEQLYYYRKGAGGSITDNEAKQEKNKRHFLKTTQMVLNIFQEEDVSKDIRNAYIVYMFENAFTHQQNCKKYALFKEFFEGIRSLLTLEDYEVLTKTLPHRSKYINFLKSDKYGRAFISLRRGKFLYRSHDGHVYIKFSINGKTHKLI